MNAGQHDLFESGGNDSIDPAKNEVGRLDGGPDGVLGTADDQICEYTTAGREAWELYRGGFAKSWSVGFLPDRKHCSPPTPAELQQHPRWRGARTIIRKARVLEYSTVTLPANVEAVNLAGRR